MTDEVFTQEDVDRIVKARLARPGTDSGTWESRARENASDRDYWRRESRKWERRAKENLAVIRAHERTIERFLDRLDDLLDEEMA